MSGINSSTTMFICNRIKEIKDKHELTVTELAKIANTKREGLHRMLSGRVKMKLDTLYNISTHFDIPMDFWFPIKSEGHGLTVELPTETVVPKKEKKSIEFIRGHSPLTKEMLRVIAQLSPSQRRRLITLSVKYPESIINAVKLAVMLGKMETSKRKRLLKAIEIIAEDNKCEPAP